MLLKTKNPQILSPKMASSGRLTQALRKSHAMGPSVRNLINQYKLDPNQIAPSGPHQTLLKGDVLSFLNQRSGGNESLQAGTTQEDSSSRTSILSAPKPATNRSSQMQTVLYGNKKYARRTLTQLEIDVINSGGLIEPPQDIGGSGKQTKKR